MNKEKNFETLSLLYQENAKVISVFWEWRNKVITTFFTGIAALFATSGWLFLQERLCGLFHYPILLGAVLSVVWLLLDIRNGRILEACYNIGKDIENEMCAKAGTFNAIVVIKGKLLTYTWILRGTFLAIFIILMFAWKWSFQRGCLQ